MEKNTLLAIVLCIVVLIASYLIQGIFFSSKQDAAASSSPTNSGQQVTPPPDQAPQETTAPMETYIPMESAPPAGTTAAEASPAESTPPSAAATPSEAAAPSESPTLTEAAVPTQSDTIDKGPAYEEQITIKTELVTVVLSSAGGDIISWKLKNHQDKNDTGDDFVEMVLSGDRQAHAFTIAFGGPTAQPISSLFYMNRISEYVVEFYRDFFVPNTESGKFRLTKRYEFKPNEYMFELTVSLDGGYDVPGFNFGGSAYTLSFGPQIGPRFKKLDNYYDYRRYISYVNGKRKEEKKVGDAVLIASSPKWSAISGKYFTCIAIPLLAQYGLNFSERAEPGIPSASRLNIMRPPLNTSRMTDTYRFYLGPKNQKDLHIYNNGNNGFGLTDMQLIEVANTSGMWAILSPLEKILKWFLMLFYGMIPNYGVAIILVTLLVKILFFPLTRKGSEATLRMQAVAPKIKEIQEKYKDNRQKMQMEMAELYKKEGYNPLSGCLPLLLQMPIFFAMYSLFNNHFDLRGAMFIPGWITDLSAPESIIDFPPGVQMPILGWTALRLLPFIYVASQLLYGKATQTPEQQANTQMKMMLYVMPIIFFFVLYNMPSGLLVYWIFSNVLTMVQQMAINRYLAPKRAAQAKAAAEAEAAKAAAAPVLPPKKKKRK